MPNKGRLRSRWGAGRALRKVNPACCCDMPKRGKLDLSTRFADRPLASPSLLITCGVVMTSMRGIANFGTPHLVGLDRPPPDCLPVAPMRGLLEVSLRRSSLRQNPYSCVPVAGCLGRVLEDASDGGVLLGGAARDNRGEQ
jgi:hypothetical protein